MQSHEAMHSVAQRSLRSVLAVGENTPNSWGSCRSVGCSLATCAATAAATGTAVVGVRATAISWSTTVRLAKHDVIVLLGLQPLHQLALCSRTPLNLKYLRGCKQGAAGLILYESEPPPPSNSVAYKILLSPRGHKVRG